MTPSRLQIGMKVRFRKGLEDTPLFDREALHTVTGVNPDGYSVHINNWPGKFLNNYFDIEGEALNTQPLVKFPKRKFKVDDVVRFKNKVYKVNATWPDTVKRINLMVVATLDSAVETGPYNEDQFEFDVVDVIPKCGHNWSKYVGLQETFDYCLICNEKRK